MEPVKYTIDATGRSLGRIASEVAIILMGKNSPDFANNKVANNKVLIENASKANISQKKKKTTEYAQYSGYPGGLKFVSMEKTIEKKGYEEVFKKAVYGMLPGNKLRSLRMKNLTITD
ncbi:50S ribosomal protein L13 [Candidatus Parcubacteria bacterium]|nr:50S ribosomal protein L13 [Candidatus Parcubacteria bacterium]